MFNLCENAIKAERAKHKAEIQKLKHQIALLEQKAKYFEHLFVQERLTLQKALLTAKLTKQ